MPSLAVARAANAAFSPAYSPVAIFVGGTSGIGKATAQAFARHTKGNAHIVIVGRNQAAADELIASFPAPSPTVAGVGSVPADGTATTPGTGTGAGMQHEFVPCDASLIRNVHATTTALRARLRKVNFLVLTPGFMSFKGREETEEGIDRRLGLHYYSRWKFIHDLLPLLRTARDAGEDAKVLSVLGAGSGVAFDPDNLGLKKNYLSGSPAQTSPTYTDLMMQSYAEQHPDIAFVHASPGIVRTPLLERVHWSMRFVNPVVMALLRPVSSSPEECAEYMLYGLLQAKEGASRRSSTGDDIGRSSLHDKEEYRRRLWEHTKEEIDRALELGKDGEHS